MKNIFIILLIIISKNLFSQTSETRYDTCSALQQYQGEWRYENGNDTIRIYLRFYRNYSQNFDLISDDLIGWHEYKKGNVIIESNYQYRFMQLPYNYDGDSLQNNLFSILMGLGGCNTAANKLWGSITDYNQNKENHNIIATLNSGGTIMNWKQEHREGWGYLTGSTGMTLPKQFTLIKQ